MFDNENRFSRQLAVAQIGPAGQVKLQQSTALIIGAGGLGSFVANLLARAGIGHLILCDGDAVELSNLHRQNLYVEADVDQPKVVALASHLQAANHALQVTLLAQWFTAELLSTYPAALVVDCTDNPTAKRAITEAAVASKRPVIAASCAGNAGEVAALPNQTNCWLCLHPSAPPSLAQAQTIGTNPAVVALTGSWQGALSLHALVDPSSVPWNQLLSLDAWRMANRRLTLTANPACPLHGGMMHD